MMTQADIVNMLKESSTLMFQKEAELQEAHKKIASLEQTVTSLRGYEVKEAKRSRCENIADKMVDAGQLDIADRTEKIASLMEVDDGELSTINAAVDLVGGNGDLPLGDLDLTKTASYPGGSSGSGEEAFWEIMNS